MNPARKDPAFGLGAAAAAAGRIEFSALDRESVGDLAVAMPVAAEFAGLELVRAPAPGRLPGSGAQGFVVSIVLHGLVFAAAALWSGSVAERAPEPIAVEVVTDQPPEPPPAETVQARSPSPARQSAPPVSEATPPVAEATHEAEPTPEPTPSAAPSTEPLRPVAEATPAPEPTPVAEATTEPTPSASPAPEPSPPVAEATPAPEPPPVADAAPKSAPPPAAEATPEPTPSPQALADAAAPLASPAPSPEPRVAEAAPEPAPLPTQPARPEEPAPPIAKARPEAQTAPLARPPPPRNPPAPPKKLSKPRQTAEPAPARTVARLANAEPPSAATQAIAPASGAAVGDYRNVIYARISSHTHYPDSALERRAEGVAMVRFSIDDAGRVTEAALVRSVGDASLDADAPATVRRASPFGPPPAGAPRAYVVPIRYRPR